MQILKRAGIGVIGNIREKLSIIIWIIIIYFIDPLQNLLFARGDYLLFLQAKSVLSNNSVISVMITIIQVVLLAIVLIFVLILLLYAFISIKEKFFTKNETTAEDAEDDDKIEEDKATVKSRTISIWGILVMVIFIYCGLTSYAVFYTDNIKISSPITPKGVNYSYSDIKSINVGSEKHFIFFFKPYYKVIFNDGKTLNLYDGEGNDKDSNLALIDIDNKLKALGINKEVDNKGNR